MIVKNKRGRKPPSYWEIASIPEKIIIIFGPPLIVFILYQIIFN